MGLDKFGREIVDPKPHALLIDAPPIPSWKDDYVRFFRGQASDIAAEAGMETFEDSNDFDVEDDIAFEDMAAPHELDDDVDFPLGDSPQEPSDTPPTQNGLNADEATPEVSSGSSPATAEPASSTHT